MTHEAKVYEGEIRLRGMLDRGSGKGPNDNPYRAMSHGWPELHLDVFRLLKGLTADQMRVIGAAYNSMSEKDQQKLLTAPRVLNLTAEISAIRDHAPYLWEQGWLAGHSPGENIDLTDLIGGD